MYSLTLNVGVLFIQGLPLPNDERQYFTLSIAHTLRVDFNTHGLMVFGGKVLSPNLDIGRHLFMPHTQAWGRL